MNRGVAAANDASDANRHPNGMQFKFNKPNTGTGFSRSSHQMHMQLLQQQRLHDMYAANHHLYGIPEAANEEVNS